MVRCRRQFPAAIPPSVHGGDCPASSVACGCCVPARGVGDGRSGLTGHLVRFSLDPIKTISASPESPHYLSSCVLWRDVLLRQDQRDRLKHAYVLSPLTMLVAGSRRRSFVTGHAMFPAIKIAFRAARLWSVISM